MNKVRIGDLLTRIKEPITIEDDKQYKRVTIKTNNQGIYLRDIEFGRNIGTKKQFIIRAGQFLLSKIDARNGAFGIVPNDLDGAIITGNFWAYEVNHELINIEWFNLFVSSPGFIDICDRASSGTTNRRYLDENKFLNFTISLPSINEQSLFVEYFKNIKQKYDFITSELSYQHNLLIRLRQSILQEAVQGKLVPQDPNDEPASVLLERIKKEKERLIKEGKIKKEKPLPTITEDEIPYELPKGWEWVRLGDIAIFENGDRSNNYPKDNELKSHGIPFISTKNILDKYICLDESQLNFISQEKFDSLRSGKVEDNDILVVLRGSVGKVGLFKKNSKYSTGFINAQLLIIRLYYKKCMNYYLYYFYSNLFFSQINKHSSGSAQQQLSASKLKEFIIPLPPLNEQKRIVEKVDQLMALCDELEKNIEQLKKDSELLMQSVLQEAFEEA